MDDKPWYYIMFWASIPLWGLVGATTILVLILHAMGVK